MGGDSGGWVRRLLGGSLGTLTGTPRVGELGIYPLIPSPVAAGGFREQRKVVKQKALAGAEAPAQVASKVDCSGQGPQASAPASSWAQHRLCWGSPAPCPSMLAHVPAVSAL